MEIWYGNCEMRKTHRLWASSVKHFRALLTCIIQLGDSINIDRSIDRFTDRLYRALIEQQGGGWLWIPGNSLNWRYTNNNNQSRIAFKGGEGAWRAAGSTYIHMYVVNRSAVNHELGSVRFDIHVILPKEIRSSVRLGHVHRLRIRRMVRHILELAIYHICMYIVCLYVQTLREFVIFTISTRIRIPTSHSHCESNHFLPLT